MDLSFSASYGPFVCGFYFFSVITLKNMYLYMELEFNLLMENFESWKYFVFALQQVNPSHQICIINEKYQNNDSQYEY